MAFVKRLLTENSLSQISPGLIRTIAKCGLAD